MSINAELADAFEAAAKKVLAEVEPPPPGAGGFPRAMQTEVPPVHPSRDPRQVAKAEAKAETLQMIAAVYRGLA